MIRTTCCILSLSLLLKVSCKSNIDCINSSVAISRRSVSSRASALCVSPTLAYPVRSQVAFVGACASNTRTATGRNLIVIKASSRNDKASPQKTMDFLRRIGKVGNTVADTECLIGVDEGNAGGCASSTKPLEKQRPIFRSCIETGVIDDMSNEFPFTNTGSRWGIFTYVFDVVFCISCSILRHFDF